MQQAGVARRAPTTTRMPSPCARASLCEGPTGRVHGAVGGRGGLSPRIPVELLCWEALDVCRPGQARRRMQIRYPGPMQKAEDKQMVNRGP